jgi:fructose-1,6-bisphosphatase II / sedoheptulose-1,7-bisphosphatase
MGIGAAPEGVISAAAMRCLGGHFQGQLIYDPEVVKTGLIGESCEGNIARLQEMGITNPESRLRLRRISQWRNRPLCRLWYSPGTLMEGVRFFHGGARTQSLVISTPIENRSLCRYRSPVRPTQIHSTEIIL